MNTWKLSAAEIGYDVPLAADHFGRLSVNDCIRDARALEPYQLAWAEDFIGFQDWRGYKSISEATTTPILTGENAFGLEEAFLDLIENRAVDIIHPDPETAGGLRETKRIADYASISTYPHGNPFCRFTRRLHGQCACRRHDQGFRGHGEPRRRHPLVGRSGQGDSKPIIRDGFITVPDTPGLGVELDEEAVKEHLREPGYFEPTPEYNNYILDDFRIRGPYPHLDEYGQPVDE